MLRNKRPPAHKFLDILNPKLSNADVKSILICQVMVLYLGFFVRITSHFQTLIYTLFWPPIGISSRNHSRPPRLGRPSRLLCTDSACNNHRSSFTVRHHFIFVRQDSFSNGHNYRQGLKFLYLNCI